MAAHWLFAYYLSLSTRERERPHFFSSHGVPHALVHRKYLYVFEGRVAESKNHPKTVRKNRNLGANTSASLFLLEISVVTPYNLSSPFSIRYSMLLHFDTLYKFIFPLYYTSLTIEIPILVLTFNAIHTHVWIVIIDRVRRLRAREHASRPSPWPCFFSLTVSVTSFSLSP